MKIIRPHWQHKLRNIEILLSYLEIKSADEVGQVYNLSKVRVGQIVKVQIKELLELKDFNFNCANFKNMQDLKSKAIQYREFLLKNL